MNAPYEEIVEGESLMRFAPGARHEAICERLHERVAMSLSRFNSARLLPPRSIVQLSPGTLVRPDLALVTSATGKVWLAAEIISSDDHRTDTVLKKQIYEEMNLPRLWMIDPRYDNVEIYHATPHGLTLQNILAGKEIFQDKLLPGFQIAVEELFGS